MSVTFYVDDWEKQPSSKVKAYTSDLYPGLDDFYFENDPYCKKDEDGRYYEERTVYENAFPELNVSNINAQSVLEAIGYQYKCAGAFPLEQLSEAIAACMKLINNESKLVVNTRLHKIDGNFIVGGLSVDSLAFKINSLMDLLVFAQKNNKGVYWG